MNFDAIVLGLGGMGSAATSALARRGVRVLGLEQFAAGHDRGSSHGQTRIIRTAYYEHPDYVPLCRASFGEWHALEQRVGRHLLTACPCLSIGLESGELVRGVLDAAQQHRLAIERFDAAALRNRYPQFQFDDQYVAVRELDAGFLYVDECVRALQDDARSHGAELRFGEPVIEWKAVDDGVAVRTEWETFSAGRLVVTAGPWAKAVLTDLDLPLTVMRQVPMWFQPANADRFGRRAFPIFIADTSEGAFYGLPKINPDGIKVARHYGAPELPGPEAVSRDVSDEDEAPVRRFLKAHIPAAAGPRSRASVCLYTLSPDRHFLIDRHPAHLQVALAAGFSGHGFKFAPVVGEVLADLATTGRTDQPVGLFTINRLVANTTTGGK
jgi:sarcosine oxidase